MWEGTFDPGVFDRHHIQKRTSVALTVFAIGRLVWVVQHLRTFMLVVLHVKLLRSILINNTCNILALISDQRSVVSNQSVLVLHEVLVLKCTAVLHF